MISTFLEALSIALVGLPLVVVAGGVIGAFLAVCHGAGRLLVAGREVSFGDRMVLSVPIGMVVLGMTAFALAAIGQLSALSVGIAGLVLVAVGHRRWRQDLGEGLGHLRALWRDRAQGSLVTPGLVAAAFLLTTGGLLLLGLYPRLDFDETLYHLPYTKAMLETGELPYLPHLRYPVFPNLQEALWTPLLATLGQSGPSALVATQTAWVGLLLAYWVGGRLGLGYGFLAAALWLGNPISWWTGTQAMVDVALALCTAVATFCVDRWEASRSHRWLVLAGIAVGGGAATKYHGLPVLGLVALAVLLGSGLRRRIIALAPLLAGAALVMLPVYGWITATTSNPVFPFASGTFGASEWSQYTRRTGGPESATEAGAGKMASIRAKGALQKIDEVPGLVARLTIPGRLEHGAPVPLSIWLLVLAPAGLWALRAPGPPRAPWRRPRIWALLFLLYFLVWFATAHEPRYLYSALPLVIPLYVAGLAAAAGWLPKKPGTAVAALATLLVLLPGLAHASREVARLGALPTNGLAREVFLQRHRLGYKALRNTEDHWAEHHGGERLPRIFTLFGSDLQFFASQPIHGDWYGPDRYSRFGDFRKPGIVEELRAEGFDYVLEVHRYLDPTIRHFPGLTPVYHDRRATVWRIEP